MHACIDGQRATGRQMPLAALERFLIELGSLQVPVNCGEVFQAKRFERMSGVPGTGLFHEFPPNHIEQFVRSTTHMCTLARKADGFRR